MSYDQASEDYRRVSEALKYLQVNHLKQPELAEVAAAINSSEYHFQRLFSRWVGISPKRFLQFLTREHAKRLLADSQSVLDTALDSGLSGPGRLHDLFVQCEAMTPGEVKAQGHGVQIGFDLCNTPFGRCLIAVTGRGICQLQFVDSDDPDAGINLVRSEWPKAEITYQRGKYQALVSQLFDPFRGPEKPLYLLLKGTNFQVKVWEALLRIPPGALVSYQQVAEAIGKPSAARAVAGAIAKNPIGFIIPCHRVIKSIGVIHGYRWGSERKKAIIGWESAQRELASRAG